MVSGAPTDLPGQRQPQDRHLSSPLPTLFAVHQAGRVQSKDGEWFHSVPQGWWKRARVSWSNPIPTTGLRLSLAEPGRAPGMEDVPVPQGPTAKRCRHFQQTLPRPGGCLKHVVQALPTERPQWLYKYCCRIRPGPPGTITKPQEEKQPVSSAKAAAVAQTTQPTSWQESNQRDAWGVS